MQDGIMTDDEPKTDAILALAPGEGTTVWFLNNLTTVKATADTTGGAYGLVESRIPAGFSPPLHVHQREDEAFWVLEGTFTFQCADRTIRAEPGSYVFLPRGVPHTFLNESDAPGRLLTLLSPGGGEGFFVEAGRPAEHDDLPTAAPIDVARLGAAARKFDMQLVGPPLQRPRA